MLLGWGEGPRNEARRMAHAIRLGEGPRNEARRTGHAIRVGGGGPRNEPADLDQCALRESFTLTVVRAID